MQLSPESLADRQMQTRRFETNNNQTMLSAAGAVLQDLGFTLDESESALGILVGSKRRDATSGGQVAGAILIALLGGPPPPVDKEQLVRVSMVMREITPSSSVEPAKATDKPSGQSIVRVTFQRVIVDTANHVTRAEQIVDPEIYKEFFDKLSQSVFLEAHEI
ncbi:MAG: hypothetical protein FWF31_03975 [Desulfobulbus sp.]|nr:hypothetical protein [Desulfobulbus sp.]